jgi:peptidoglycan/LPS O-acetylase OafA/YrhL
VGSGLVLAILFALGSRNPVFPPYFPAVEMCPYGLAFGGIILLSVLHPALFGGGTGRALGFLGDISYGLYLIHQFIMNCYDQITVGSWLANLESNGTALLLRPFICIPISIGLATLSRYTIEQRFLGLKGTLAAR